MTPTLDDLTPGERAALAYYAFAYRNHADRRWLNWPRPSADMVAALQRRGLLSKAKPTEEAKHLARACFAAEKAAKEKKLKAIALGWV